MDKKIGNKLRDTFEFKNIAQTAKAFHTSPANLQNLNTRAAGISITNAYLVIIALAETIPPRKRKIILSNIDFVIDKKLLKNKS